MRIAVCDLDKNFLKNFKDMLYLYAGEKKIEILTECFVSGETLISNITDYNLIFLGYDLSGINGLETAKILRKKQNNAPIIFVSDYTKFVFDAFKVSAFRFLLKSKWETELYPLLDDFLIQESASRPIFIKSREGTECINTSDIYYLEADNKYCFVNLKNSTLSCHRTMAKVFEALPQNGFVKISRAFVVNLNHISRYNNDTIILKNGKILHPSRNFYKNFKDEYRRFLKPYEIQP